MSTETNENGDAWETLCRVLSSFPERSYVSLTLNDAVDDEIIESLHSDHFRTARTNFVNWVMLEAIAANAKGEEGRLSASIQATSFRLASIVFTATSLEAAINYFAKKHAIRFANDYEKNMNTLAKWQIYPEQVYGKHLADHFHGHVKRIFHLRDRIVHPKPVWTTKSKIDGLPLFGPSQGAYMINIAGDAMAELLQDDDVSFVGAKFPNAYDWEKNCYIP